MRFMNRRALGGVAALALALPPGASAHPGVFTTVAKVAPAGVTNPTEAQLTDETQYAISNDGYAIVLRESNGVSAPGLIDYKKMPSAFRASFSKDQLRTYAPAQTPVQPHATCSGVAALQSGANILSWQTDPFYNYIPWQATAVGIADEPAKWLPVVKAATGVDLAALSSVGEFASACTNLGGTYRAADTVVTTPTNISSATVAAAVMPVQAQVTTLNGQLAAADQRAATAEASAASARTDAARLLIAATPLAFSLDGNRAAGALVAGGQPVNLTGAPMQPVTVRIVLGEVKAKSLRLRSRVLASATTMLGAGGTARLILKPTGAAAAAIKKSKRTLAVTIDAAAGQRVVSKPALIKR